MMQDRPHCETCNSQGFIRSTEKLGQTEGRHYGWYCTHCKKWIAGHYWIQKRLVEKLCLAYNYALADIPEVTKKGRKATHSQESLAL